MIDSIMTFSHMCIMPFYFFLLFTQKNLKLYVWNKPVPEKRIMLFDLIPSNATKVKHPSSALGFIAWVCKSDLGRLASMGHFISSIFFNLPRENNSFILGLVCLRIVFQVKHQGKSGIHEKK